MPYTYRENETPILKIMVLDTGTSGGMNEKKRRDKLESKYSVYVGVQRIRAHFVSESP